jgi:RNA polymerase sigma-70 factor (ECF subfamily)
VGTPAVAATDLDLAQRAATGDRTSQRAVFVAHRAGVHRTLFRILGNNRDLEDLVQDAFLEIFRSLKSFRGDSSLGRWCQIIATRVAYLAISRRKPPSVDLALVEDELTHDERPDRVVQARIAAKRLYVALDRLDAKHRVAFALAVIDERPLSEVAELTESTRFAVKTRVWRARRELRSRASKDAVLAAYLVELGGES